MVKEVNRPFEVTACGAFCLSEARRDLQRFFKVGTEIVAFHDAEELRRLARYYLSHPDEARDQVANARARVLAENTYEHRARPVLRTIGS